jgi:protein-L-isoaspartate(D-aspartate) O-methyltransferase
MPRRCSRGLRQRWWRWKPDAALAALARTALAPYANVESGGRAARRRPWAAEAHYDLLIVDGAVEQLPDALIEQLKPSAPAW